MAPLLGGMGSVGLGILYDQCNVEDDKYLRFCALFVKTSLTLFRYEESIREGDAVTSHMVTIEAVPLFEISGKSKMVNLVFHMIENASTMKPSDLAQEFKNHCLKMNKSKGSIAADDVSEKGNLLLKDGEALPTDKQRLVVRTFFMGLANLCLTTRRALLQKKKNTKRSKEPVQPEQRAAALGILSSASVNHSPGRNNADLATFSAIYKVQSNSSSSSEDAGKRTATGNEENAVNDVADDASLSSGSEAPIEKTVQNDVAILDQEYSSDNDSDFDPFQMLDEMFDVEDEQEDNSDVVTDRLTSPLPDEAPEVYLVV